MFLDQSTAGLYYLGVGTDLYRSKDSGSTWVKLTYPGLMGSINYLSAHPHNSSTIYALTPYVGLYSLVEASTPPAVVSRIPVQNATAVSIQSPVSITFDKTLLPASVSATSIAVTKLSAANISGSVSLTGPTITFTPSSPLEYGATYVVNVPAGIKDIDGTPTTSATSWQFSTEPVPLKTLTVSFTGSGTGTVKGTPDKLSCQVGGNCAGLYDLNSSVSLAATPHMTSYFVEWQGFCQGTNPIDCLIASLNSDLSVSAQFDLMPIYNSSLLKYYMDITTTLQDAGLLDSIFLLQAKSMAAPVGGLAFNLQKTVKLYGGHDSAFNTRSGLTSIVVGSTGPVVISKGTVVFDRIAIK